MIQKINSQNGDVLSLGLIATSVILVAGIAIFMAGRISSKNLALESQATDSNQNSTKTIKPTISAGVPVDKTVRTSTSSKTVTPEKIKASAQPLVAANSNAPQQAVNSSTPTPSVSPNTSSSLQSTPVAVDSGPNVTFTTLTGMYPSNKPKVDFVMKMMSDFGSSKKQAFNDAFAPGAISLLSADPDYGPGKKYDNPYDYFNADIMSSAVFTDLNTSKVKYASSWAEFPKGTTISLTFSSFDPYSDTVTATWNTIIPAHDDIAQSTDSQTIKYLLTGSSDNYKLQGLE